MCSIQTPPSLFPSPSHKTAHFRERYNLIHARLLRNESFQLPTLQTQPRHSLSRSDPSLVRNYSITPIANLLGRSGSSHLLLGLVGHSPAGGLLLTDPTGGISLNLQHAQPTIGVNGAWFCPGMIVLVDGVYEGEPQGYGPGNGVGGNFGDIGGVGGTIGGQFVGFSIAHPPAERRNVSLGIADSLEAAQENHGGFGWTDFLGLGSERATGSRMRRVQQRIYETGAPHAENNKMVILGEIDLATPKSLHGLRKVLSMYAELDPGQMPVSIIILGNFVRHAALAGAAGSGSIEYKECFDGLASVLGEFPQLLRHTTMVFVPGDNDAWTSAFSAGAATPLPRQGVPDLFTSRVRRVLAEANKEGNGGRDSKAIEGQIVWASNPARISLFGPTEEMVVFRDDMTGRLRRTCIKFGQGQEMDDETNGQDAVQRVDAEAMEVDGLSPSTLAARKLVRTILDQSCLSPFSPSTRPVLWDYSSSLNLYPLPSTLILGDAEAPAFALTYEGCHVMNPGKMVREGRGRIAGWIEYDITTRKGEVKEVPL